MASSPSTTRDCSRANSGIASVQPEQTSVTTRLLMNEPATDSPQWATRSISRYPGSGSFQSEKVRTGMRLPIFLFCLRFLRLPACSLMGLSSLSMVAALAANSRRRTSGSRSRCPCLSSDSTILGSAAFSLFPHILSEASHTTVSASLTASSYILRPLGTALGDESSPCPRSLTACFRWQPVMATNSSSIRLLSFFDASLYRLRMAPSNSVLVAKLMSPSISCLLDIGNNIVRQ